MIDNLNMSKKANGHYRLNQRVTTQSNRRRNRMNWPSNRDTFLSTLLREWSLERNLATIKSEIGLLLSVENMLNNFC